MNPIWIERLTLQVPGLSRHDGQRLALQVAERLGALGTLHGGREVSSLRLDLTVSAGAGVDELARLIVAQVIRQVELSA